MTQGPLRREEKCSIYVTRLPCFVTYDMVREKFEEFGKVKRVYLQTSAGNTYAFVSYRDQESAQCVLNWPRSIRFGEHPVDVKKRLVPISKPESPAATQKPAAQKQATGENTYAHNFAPPLPLQLRQEEVPQLLPLAKHASIPLPEPEVLRKMNRVLRVDGIPRTWTAEILYKHLVTSGLAVNETLVYSDFDSRQLCQGLIQLDSHADAYRIASKAVLYTSQLSFAVIVSAVQNIASMRVKYSGRFTAYSALEDAEKYGYSVAEPCEPVQSKRPISTDEVLSTVKNINLRPPPLAVPTEFPQRKQCPRPPRDEKSLKHVVEPIRLDATLSTVLYHDDAVSPSSPESDAFSPQMGSQCSPNSPPSPTYSHLFKPEGIDSPSVFVETMRSPVMLAEQYFNAGSVKTQAFVSISLPHQPSKTVVIDNFWPAYAYDAKTVAQSMMPFGQVLVADLVPLSPTETRAYVTFATPISAEVALCRLRVSHSGPNELKVRLA